MGEGRMQKLKYYRLLLIMVNKFEIEDNVLLLSHYCYKSLMLKIIKNKMVY